MLRLSFLCVLYLLLWACPAARAQSPAPKYEMRGIWVATVINLDWPVRGASPQAQQAALRAMFDRLKASGINAVFFQVRSESDAMYASTIEPWSYYLTGTQGLPPAPLWDPLAFAVEEAHKRGMELHAWINPYRVIRSISSTYPKALNHLSVKRPEWMLPVQNVLLLNPGIPEARQYLVGMLSDMVSRYDIDGLHYDDYFYPYEGIKTEDQATYAAYGNGMTLDAWREDNINRFVQEMGAAALKIKPWLKYGVSPFGIWRSGVPSGITGLSGASVTYGNGVRWLQERWIDYLSPQLYWAFGGGQDFARLSLWWKEQLNGRHLYPGLAAYKAEPSMTAAASLYRPNELPRQIRFLRENQIGGNLLFRAANLTATGTQGLADSLRSDLYRYPALTPIMPWKNMQAPATPINAQVLPSGSARQLQWLQPPAGGEQPLPRFFAVYRVASDARPNWTAAMQNPEHLLAIVAEPTYTDPDAVGEKPFWYAITAVSANSVESAPATPDLHTALREAERGILRGVRIFPNPFDEELHIAYRLEKEARVSIRISDAQGRELARPVEQEQQQAGEQEVIWVPHLRAGRQVYFISIDVNGKRTTKRAVAVAP